MTYEEEQKFIRGIRLSAMQEAAEICKKNASAIREANEHFGFRKPRGEWRAQQADTDAAAILAKVSEIEEQNKAET